MPKLSFKTLNFITRHAIAGVHLHNFVRCPLDIIAAMLNKTYYIQLELGNDAIRKFSFFVLTACIIRYIAASGNW